MKGEQPFSWEEREKTLSANQQREKMSMLSTIGSNRKFFCLGRNEPLSLL